MRLECNPAYPIEFGLEKHSAGGRWDHFQVKDPRLPEQEEGLPLLPQHLMHEESEPQYGTQTRHSPGLTAVKEREEAPRLRPGWARAERHGAVAFEKVLQTPD